MGVGILTIIGLYDLISSQFPQLNLPIIGDYVHWLDWKIWLLIALVLSLIGTLEGTYRYVKRIKADNENRISRLKREERKQGRQRYSDRNNIPTLLFKMYECSKTLAVANKRSFFGEKAEAVAKSLSSAGLLTSKQLEIEKMDSIEEIKWMLKRIPETKWKELYLDTYGAMRLHGEAISPESNAEYSSFHSQVKLLQNGLPYTINGRIMNCILLSNAFANTLSWDFSTADIPDGVSILLQYMIPSMDSWTQTMRDEISKMIEDFLLGEDID